MRGPRQRASCFVECVGFRHMPQHLSPELTAALLHLWLRQTLAEFGQFGRHLRPQEPTFVVLAEWHLMHHQSVYAFI
jgi:hypothetical protein